MTEELTTISIEDPSYLLCCLCDAEPDTGLFEPCRNNPHRIPLIQLIRAGVRVGLGYVDKNGDVQHLTEDKLKEWLNEKN